LIVFIDDHPDLLAFLVLGRNIDVLLLPVDMHFKLDFVVDLRL